MAQNYQNGLEQAIQIGPKKFKMVKKNGQKFQYGPNGSKII